MNKIFTAFNCNNIHPWLEKIQQLYPGLTFSNYTRSYPRNQWDFGKTKRKDGKTVIEYKCHEIGYETPRPEEWKKFLKHEMIIQKLLALDDEMRTIINAVARAGFREPSIPRSHVDFE